MILPVALLRSKCPIRCTLLRATTIIRSRLISAALRGCDDDGKGEMGAPSGLEEAEYEATTTIRMAMNKKKMRTVGGNRFGRETQPQKRRSTTRSIHIPTTNRNSRHNKSHVDGDEDGDSSEAEYVGRLKPCRRYVATAPAEGPINELPLPDSVHRRLLFGFFETQALKKELDVLHIVHKKDK